MTFYELLHSVTFDEIIPFLEKKSGGPVSLVLYKTHYDMLRLLTPRIGEGDSKTASITNAKLDYDGEEPHLDAYPLEGDFWEVCLAKELVIAPDVNASLGEIAACIPALSESVPISLNFLCNLFYANHYIQYSYQTYTGNAAKRSEWMLELIKKYDAFCGPIRPNAVILVTVSPEHPFCDSDRQLTDKIERMCSGRTALLLKYDDRLDEELRLDVAFYEL